MTGLTDEQPPPVPNDGPDMWLEVIRDMEARRAHGIAEYGTPLQPHNGRKPLTDAYQEVLDQSVYLRQAIAEQEQLAADLRLFFDCMSCLWVYSSGAAPRQAEARLREFARTGLPQAPPPRHPRRLDPSDEITVSRGDLATLLLGIGDGLFLEGTKYALAEDRLRAAAGTEGS